MDTPVKSVSSGGGATPTIDCTPNSTCGHANNSSTTTISATLSTASASGIAAAVLTINGRTGTPSIAGASLTWTVACNSSGANDICLGTAPYSSQITSQTITVTLNGTGFNTLDVGAFTHVSTVDGSVQTGAVDPLSVTTTGTPGLVVCGFRNNSASDAPGTGWSAINTSANFQTAMWQEFATSGAKSCTLSTTGQANGSVGVALK